MYKGRGRVDFIKRKREGRKKEGGREGKKIVTCIHSAYTQTHYMLKKIYIYISLRSVFVWKT